MSALTFDNQVIDICGIGFEPFKKAMSFFFNDTTKAKCFAVDPAKGLILYWAVTSRLEHREEDKTSGGKPIMLLPYEMTFEPAVNFVWGWLQTAAYGSQPDHDGDNGKGWRVYNEAWTHVDDRWEALVAIQPIWAMYGK